MDDTPRTHQIHRRRAEVVAAGHRGDTATVADGLDDDDPTIRSAAIGATVRLAADEALAPDAATDAVLAGLDDDTTAVRRRAAEEAARWAVSDPRTDAPDAGRLADALLRRFTDDDSVVEVAAFATGEVPFQDHRNRSRAVRALSSLATSHSDHLCRESAVAALGSIGDPAGLDAVLHGCTDRANVRRRAVLALAAFDDDRASDAMRQLLDDRDLQVRQAAEELLAIESGEAT